MALTKEDVADARAQFVALRGEAAAADMEKVYGDSDASLYLAFRHAIRDAEDPPTTSPHQRQSTRSDFAQFAQERSADIYKRANRVKAGPACGVPRIDDTGK